MTIVVRYIPIHKQYRNLSRSAKKSQAGLMIGFSLIFAIFAATAFGVVSAMRFNSGGDGPGFVIFVPAILPCVGAVAFFYMGLKRFYENHTGNSLCGGRLANWTQECGTDTHLRDNIMNFLDSNGSLMIAPDGSGALLMQRPIYHDQDGNEVAIVSVNGGLTTNGQMQTAANGLVAGYTLPQQYQQPYGQQYQQYPPPPPPPQQHYQQHYQQQQQYPQQPQPQYYAHGVPMQHQQQVYVADPNAIPPYIAANQQNAAVAAVGYAPNAGDYGGTAAASGGGVSQPLIAAGSSAGVATGYNSAGAAGGKTV